ncbi:MAG TPA: GNAT family N-acetyltransferase [Anaerolineales bacterium]|nr:GNAT family N-acetyltransferase [Anaerolineales bacterium]
MPSLSRPQLVLPRETERLVLRSPSVEHAEEIQRAIEETYENLHLWMPWAADMPTLADTRTFLEGAQTRFAAGEEFAVSGFLKSTGEYVLGSGLHPRKWNVPSFEIGYWCRASRQRQGYTTEAVRALTEVAFTEMHAERVEIRCDSRNVPSRRVAERAGFRLEATLHSDDRAMDRSLRDTLVYVRLRRNWSNARPSSQEHAP